MMMMMMKVTTILCLLVAATTVTITAAFHQQAPLVKVVVGASKTRLNAWTLPNAPSFSSFQLGSTWYNEYHPTAKNTVKNDDSPFEFYSSTFMSFGMEEDGESWLFDSFDDVEEDDSKAVVEQQQPARRGRGPIRRAARWARRRLSGGNGASP